MTRTGSSPLRAAVIGAGYLGPFHGDKYASLENVELVGIVDIDPTRAAECAQRCHTRAFTDYRALFNQVDCVSLAVPTTAHAVIARDLLQHGIDVLVEKPLTATVAEGRELVAVAEACGRILQVGHLERFNPAIRSLAGVLTQPRFIECHRLASFVERGTEVDVILDLMIHDLDVILSVVRGEVERIEAVGVPVLTEQIDIANARLRFSSGCIANVTASRVATKRERKIRFFQSDTYVSVDYDAKYTRILRRRAGASGSPEIDAEELQFTDADSLLAEITDFVDAVRHRRAPVVDGRAALRALEVAHRIKDAVETI
ncbi:MAG: Gfo/Idh/MocA family oxidoreductase [Deltaproteobacteria bacterium]|nr:Gfo/Idh/MocA family oxidoreductase [Deltaproteobacteria bacterium]MBI3387302.1 Gfo/Idh/MocA family oxidoreductase [Deltaproteobacteria bacterium]